MSPATGTATRSTGTKRTKGPEWKGFHSDPLDVTHQQVCSGRALHALRSGQDRRQASLPDGLTAGLAVAVFLGIDAS